jgi:glucan-binding YG repeat protein
MRFYKYLPAILAAVALCAVSGEASAENTPADITSISEADTNNSGEDEILLSGWVQDLDGKTFYYTEDGTLTKGIAEIDGDTYYFAPNGVMKTGWFTIDGKRVFFDFNTGKRMDGWINYLDGIFYSDPQYGKLTGKQTINNNTYYFNENGKLYTDWFVLDGVKYYGGSDGAIRTGESEIDGITYHFSPTGRFESGWQTSGGKRIFFDYETAKPVYGWIHYNGLVYYADETTGKFTGDHTIENNIYRFTDSGYMAAGLQKFEDGTRFYNTDGTIAKGFVASDGNTYYFGEDYLMKTGWQNISEDRYFFTETGEMAVGLYEIDGQNYYFNESGKMQTGIQKAGNYRYYFNESGIMQTGFVTYNGNSYYCGTDGVIKIGWLTLDSGKYYFDSEGVMALGFKKLTSGIYYFGNDGILRTGWQTVNGNKYYSEKDGKLKIGWQILNSKKYYFLNDGAMATNFCKVGSDTYYFGNDGVMKTGWQTVGGKKYYLGSNGVMATYRHKIDNKNYCFLSTGEMVITGSQEIVVLALTQLGNVGGQPYWSWYGFNFRIEWCACFVSWCAAHCGYTQNEKVPIFISCAVGIKWFREHNQWRGKNYTPVSGDYIFFDWEPDGVADHIGIVDYVENGYVYTVEGNSNDTCRTKSYRLDSENIFGYAHPSYQP